MRSNLLLYTSIIVTIIIVNNKIKLNIVITITICYNNYCQWREVRLLAEKKTKPKIPMEHHNMADFLRGQSSKILTRLANEDKTAFIQKNGKPIIVVMSNDRYERLLKEGIDINEY